MLKVVKKLIRIKNFEKNKPDYLHRQSGNQDKDKNKNH